MQTLMVRIGEQRITPPREFEEGVYEFPTKDDETLFYDSFPNSREVVETTFNKQASFQYYLAWRALEKLGWVHDGSKDGYLWWVYPTMPADKLELALKHHDWYYMMSDDYRWFSSGQKEQDRIKEMMKEVGEPLASEMYHKYAR